MSPGGDPAIDFRFKHGERHRALTEHTVMKPAEVELRTEPLLGAASQREQALLADLVGERLPGPGDVSIHLELDLGVGERAVVAQTSDRLVPRPAHRVHAGVDY